MANNTRYEDEKPNNFPNDFNKKDIDPRVALRTESVRNKMYGDDVREGISQAAEISSAVATESNKNSTSAKKTAEETEKRFDAQINGQDKDDEAKDARVSTADGKTYNVLKDRLDAIDKKPQAAVDNLTIDNQNLIKNSDFWLTSDGKYQQSLESGIDVADIAGKQVTLSFQLNLDKVTALTDRKRIILSLEANNGKTTTYLEAVADGFEVGDSFNGAVVNTVTIPEDTTTIKLSMFTQGVQATNMLTGRPKLQLGTKYTGWSPNADDSHHHQAFNKGTRFFAHRGAQSLAPENSLPAIRMAGNHAGVEIDIHVTSDGQWVVMHDGTVDRMTNGQGAISSFTLADLRKLRFDTGSNLSHFNDAELVIPTLEEAFTACKDNQLIPVIELKKNDTDHYTDDDWDNLAKIVKRFRLEDELLFISFDYDCLKAIKQRLPLVEVSWLGDGITNDNIAKAQALGVNSGLDLNISGATMQANVINDNVVKAHEAGLTVGAWTTQDDSNRNMLVGAGVDFITTNSLSGEKRYQELTLHNGWRNTNYNDYPIAHVQEISKGVIELYMVISAGNNQNARQPQVLIAGLPYWATPVKEIWNKATVKSGSGVQLGTFDIHDDGSVVVGLGWTGPSQWVACSTIYHV